MRAIPGTITAPASLTQQHENTIERLKVAAHDATGNIDRFVRRGKEKEAQYYAGKRDAYLHAVNMLENT